MNAGILNVIAAIAYLAAAALYFSAVIGAVTAKRARRITIGRICALAGVFLNTAEIGYHCVTTHHTPVGTPLDLLYATGWAVAIAYLAIEWFMRDRRPMALGALSFTLSFFAIFCASAIKAKLPNRGTGSIDLDNAVVSLHVMAIMFAFTCLFLAVCCASIYIFEHRMLKQKKVAGGLFGRLPPLSTLDALSFGLVSIGFPLLSIGILAGAIRAVAKHLPFADLHTAMALITWALLGSYLFVHASALGKGVRANYLLIFCLICALLTYMVQNQMHHFV